MIHARTIRQIKWMVLHVALPITAMALTWMIGPAVARFIHTASNQATHAQSQLTGQLAAHQLGDAELMAVQSVRQPAPRNAARSRSITTLQIVRKVAPTPTAPSILTTVPQHLVTAAVLEPVAHQSQAAVAKVAQQAPESWIRTQLERHPEYRVFNGRLIRPARTLSMVTTAYSPDERSCGLQADGITASGKSVWTNGMKMVAADTRLLPFGSIVSIPGYYNGQPVPVLDRGGAIKGHRLDVLYPTHEIALTWGRQRQKITVWEYVR